MYQLVSFAIVTVITLVCIFLTNTQNKQQKSLSSSSQKNICSMVLAVISAFFILFYSYRLISVVVKAAIGKIPTFPDFTFVFSYITVLISLILILISSFVNDLGGVVFKTIALILIGISPLFQIWRVEINYFTDEVIRFILMRVLLTEACVVSIVLIIRKSSVGRFIPMVLIAEACVFYITLGTLFDSTYYGKFLYIPFSMELIFSNQPFESGHLLAFLPFYMLVFIFSLLPYTYQPKSSK